MTPGDERRYPPAVGVGEPQLRAGVRALFAQDQPGPGRPCGQVDQAATQAPSRISPVDSIAGYQAFRG
jgi:hypothetical protein